MSQDQNNPNRPPRFNGRPGGNENPDQPSKKGPRFSIYWIYAIIFAVLIGFQLFNPLSPNMAETNDIEFKSMVAAGDVSKAVIVKNRDKVKVYLTSQGQQKYAEKLKKGVSGKINEDGPHMYFGVTSADTFKKEISEFFKSNPTIKEIPILSTSD